MKRIDTLNARPDLFGVGKAGFSDNADLPGQDATYLSPDWLNVIQEELCNLLELNEIGLDPNSKQQLFELLITRTDLVNDLTTGGTDKPLTAEQGKIINDKFGAQLLPRGHQKYLSGKIDQWLTLENLTVGNTVGSTLVHAFSFSFSFPNRVLHVFATPFRANLDSDDANQCSVSIESKDNSGGQIRLTRVAGNNTGTEKLSVSVFAIGY